MEIPYVSVVVSMYNVEKYIGELLDSLLAQTLKNFEVIIVDDCSTDKSFEIVESYQPKFKGRMKLMKLPTNSGGCSVPRNKGLKLAIGKYIFVMDSDDALTKTALEELYTLAEKSQAEVVYCMMSFQSSGVGEEFFNNAKIFGKKISDVPVFLTEDLGLRMQARAQGIFRVPPWLSFCRRDFLIKSNLKFTPVRRDDEVWTLMLLCLAKKFLMVPNACVIYRTRDDSITWSDRPLDKYFRHWLDRTVTGLKIIDDFLSEIDFFKTHPEYRFSVLYDWVNGDLEMAFNKSISNSPLDIIQNFHKEFKNDLGDKDALVSYLFINSIIQKRNLAMAYQKIHELSAPPRAGFKIEYAYLLRKICSRYRELFYFFCGLIAKRKL